MSADSSLLQSTHGEPEVASASEGQQSHAATSSTVHSHGALNRPRRASARKNNPTKSQQPCRFFASKNGCRAGDQCRFQHIKHTDVAISAQLGNLAEATNPSETLTAHPTPSPPGHAGPVLAASRPLSKPISQRELENPREYQITQVVRRFSPFRADLDDHTSLKFRLAPTDPDFPFELDTGLHCVLNVPSGYPQDGVPSLQVQNPEMSKGFQINVEKGFDSLVGQYPGKNLLALLNELDKDLEKFLSSAKATTVKFVAPVREKFIVHQSRGPNVPPPDQQRFFQPVTLRYGLDQLKEAKIRRDAEVRQLEARLGRSDKFSKASDGNAFNVPLQVPSSTTVPLSLRSLRESALIVPEVYPLEPCTIILRGVDGADAENVEVAYEKHVVSNPQLSLMAHINYLTQNLGKLAVDTRPQLGVVSAPVNELDKDATATAPSIKAKDEGVSDPNRPHVKYIARPPEWAVHQEQASLDETDSSEFESEDDHRDDDAEDSEIESAIGGAFIPAVSSSGIERGVSISFPGLSLNGIELLELTKLSITIKCERCKQAAEIRDIIPSKSDDPTNIYRTETCAKCTAPFTFTFRPELLHMNNTRAGHIDIENSTIVSLLPCNFQPTCGSCSTPFPSPPGVTTIPGDTTLTICRTCHSKMTLQLPTAKFLRTSTAATTSTSLSLRPRKQKDPLISSLTANTPLPSSGLCEHYKHSHRWFRFSCCNTVYPCDKCHDTSPTQKADPHPNEHADRMICGWCSREQRYHPETCRFCGSSVVRRREVSGFWEGGKGTRDRNLMRRKEGRKFHRSGKEKKEVEAARRKRVEEKGKGGMWWPA